MTTPIDECWVISLRHRPERLHAFATGLSSVSGSWPFPPVQVFPAINGKRTGQLPLLWRNAGQYGCWLSHLTVLRDALSRGAHSVMVFEDDAELLPDFAAQLVTLMNLVPTWEMLSLGGEHLRRPIPIWGALRVRMAVRTHAYVVRDDALRRLVDVLTLFHGAYAHDWEQAMAMQWYRWYAPENWFVAQRAGLSDITGDLQLYRNWQPTYGRGGIGTGPEGQ